MRIFLIALFLVAFGFVACDDSGTSSTEQNADTEQVSSSSVNTIVEQESSSSVVANDAKLSSSSEKDVEVKSSSSNSSIQDYSYGSEEKKTVSSSSLVSFSSDTKQSSSSEKDVEVKSSSSNSSIQDYSYGSEEKKTVSSSSLVSFSSSQNEELKYSSSSVTPDESSDSSAFPDGWSWDVPKETYLNPKIAYDSIVDPRDGKIYKTVMIGDQVWMAENLNYADSVKTPSLKGKSWCYNNVAANCDVAGRLYTWAAAIDSVKLANDADNPQDCGVDKICTLPDTVYGICPPGWHLPDTTEWFALFLAVGGSKAGKALKSQSGWYSNGNGTDAFGFSALPVGNRGYGGAFNDEGYDEFFWSSSKRNSCMYLSYSNDGAYLSVSYEGLGFSVRCVKD